MSNRASNIPSLDLAIVPGTVYIQDCVWNQLSKLYTLDLATGKATFIGELVTELYIILPLLIHNSMASIEYELDKMLVASDFAPLKEEKNVAFYYENNHYLLFQID